MKRFTGTASRLDPLSDGNARIGADPFGTTAPCGTQSKRGPGTRSGRIRSSNAPPASTYSTRRR